jgi:GC-rich sequence DNA-binding factor
MFNKRVKSRPSLRARDSDVESIASPLGKSVVNASPAQDVQDEDEQGSGSVLERKKAQKKDKRLSGVKSGGTRLSFGGDGDEGEGFRPKKSLLSQNIKLPHSAGYYTSSPGASGVSSYSREYLSELKASTPTRAPRTATDGDDEEDEPMDGADLRDEEDGTGLSRLAREKYASNFAEDTTAGIPDAAAVASARMKRQARVELAKHGGEVEEDYIALGGGRVVVHDGRAEGPHPESRLMREEDEGEEFDEGE